jgi:F0F1-type ATP synthase membrane subunit c/vacuolar-type H+-ATPase subunit K
MKKVWTFKLNGSKHVVEVDASWLSGKISIRVDGKVLERKRVLVDVGRDIPFEIDGHSCVVRTAMLLKDYDLIIDGRSITTGQTAPPLRPMPRWAWAFIAACIAIPVVSLGGAIPAGIGVGGAVACMAISKDLSKTERKRIFMCLGVTIFCWILFFLIVYVIFLLRGS